MKNKLFHTLQGKLILLVSMFAVISLVFLFENYGLTKGMSQKYAELVDQRQLLHEYTKTLAECNAVLLKYSNLTEDKYLVHQYERSCERLIETADKLCEAFPDPYIENLSQLSEGFSEQGKMVIAETEKGNIEAAHEICRQFLYSGSLMNKYLLYVEQSMSEVSMQRINRLNSQQNQILHSMMAVFCCMVVVVTLLSFMGIRNMVRPIKHLTEMAHLVMQNVWELPQWNHPQKDETGVLMKSFYHMVQTIRGQIEILKQQQKMEMERKEEEKKELHLEYRNVQLELKALQNQINPHFLFNCLNMISKQAYIEEARDTQHTTEAVARYLRSVLDQRNEIVTMEQELKGIQNYLVIQSMRFGDRFRYELNCDADCGSLYVPFMILQPLVENVFTHGIDCCAGEICLSCSVKRIENGVWICVEDNGPGMEEEKVKQLRSMAKEISGDVHASGIGLVNVFRRMQLYFGNQVEIFVESRAYDKTVIGFLIPKEGLTSVSGVRKSGVGRGKTNSRDNPKNRW